MRISVPDLLQKTQNYLSQLNAYIENPTERNYNSYNWGTLDLIDQSIRTYSGGLLMKAAKSGKITKSQIKSSWGDVFDYLLENRKQSQKERRKSSSNIYYRIRRRIKKLLTGMHPHTTREANMWLYDDLFLSDELVKAGFTIIGSKEFDESEIPNYEKYAFDTSRFGHHPIEPSLIVEAKK